MSKKRKLSGARYVGDGNYILGVPARDLTAGEWDALPEERRRVCLAAGVFEVDGPVAPEVERVKSEVKDDSD